MSTPKNSELSLMPEHQVSLSHSNPIAPLLEAIVKSGVNTESVAALEKLTQLYERMEDRNAEKSFAAAFVELQNDMPVVNATKAVPNKDGTTRYKFAPYEDIMETVKPVLQRHGFTITFSMSFGEGRVTQTCTLQHKDGHSRQNQFMVRIGNGPPGSSEAQGDGAASTYAKRFALCNALNIVCEVDTDANKDARFDGAPIADDKAQYLKELVKETGSDEAAFLKFAGASKYEEIAASRYDSLIVALNKKRK